MRAWFAAIVMVVGVAGCGTVIDLQPDASASQLANGEPCTTNTECASTSCVDGYCCNTACDGTCEACDVVGSFGTCSPVAANTDPAMECKPIAPPDAGGTTDGGVAFDLPDGGITIEGSLCAGSCDGNRACQYPDQTKSCGDTFCSTGVEVEKAVCDSQGHCAVTPFECSGYVCGDNVCKTSCTVNSDCDSDHYCNTSGACVPKLGVGTTCLNGTQCGTGFCDDSVCCSTDCSAVTGGACAQPGSVGQCVCAVNNVTCTTGCEPYYPDQDGDGYGDVNGTAIAGCGSTVPQPGYVANNSDCYDKPLSISPRAADAFPGSSYYGTQDRGDGSFDYDCDGVQSKFYVERPGAVCGECSGPVTNIRTGARFCFGPDTGYCAANTTATDQLYQECDLAYNSFSDSYNCVGSTGFFHYCLQGQPCPTSTASFVETVPCGESGEFIQCGTCSNGTSGQTTSYPIQSCN